MFLTNLSMEVQKRLQRVGLRGRRVTLKVMMRKAGAPVEPAKYGGHGICDNLARWPKNKHFLFRKKNLYIHFFC